MIRHSIRSSRSIALCFSLGVIAAVGIAGCTASEPGSDELPVEPSVQHQRITQDKIAALSEGQFLSLDLSENTVFAIDYSKAPVDYSRIKLSTREGKEVLLETQMAAVENGDYGDYPAPVFREASDQRFRIASDPAYFGVLTQSELDQLKVDGYFYSETPPPAPQSRPQSDDGCVHAVCEICVDNDTGGSPVTWEQGTYTCYLVEHTWC
ncbi:hypothetical protein WMF31_33575 [Sorangium sp. So ce1036]|uniref:hypothetical protein n=1 Tax=Sorangium sp. So ce1036 TaxID=3133328 RepID=UPI003F071C67